MLEVIGVGQGRTGTFSLKTALEQLGFGPCYHAYELFAHPEHVDRWERRLAGTASWDEVFAGYRATTDFPGVSYWRELVDTYPNAKVVLTVRDPEKWFDSVRTSVLRQMDEGPLKPDSDGANPVGRLMERMMNARPDFDFHDRDAMVEQFRRHNDEVRQTVPSDRLLVFEVGQGWQPLCEFLGLPVPENEFPRRNDTEEFERLIRQNDPS